jgi:hypothetical protein
MLAYLKWLKWTANHAVITKLLNCVAHIAGACGCFPVLLDTPPLGVPEPVMSTPQHWLVIRKKSIL